MNVFYQKVKANIGCLKNFVKHRLQLCKKKQFYCQVVCRKNILISAFCLHTQIHRWVCWQNRWKLRGSKSAIYRTLWWSISTNSTPRRRCYSRYSLTYQNTSYIGLSNAWCITGPKSGKSDFPQQASRAFTSILSFHLTRLSIYPSHMTLLQIQSSLISCIIWLGMSYASWEQIPFKIPEFLSADYLDNQKYLGRSDSFHSSVSECFSSLCRARLLCLGRWLQDH